MKYIHMSTPALLAALAILTEFDEPIPVDLEAALETRGVYLG